MGWWDKLLGRGKKMADEAVDKARDVIDRDKEPAPGASEAPPPPPPGTTAGGGGTTAEGGGTSPPSSSGGGGGGTTS